MSDPLAFFAGDGSSSESEEDEPTGRKDRHADTASDRVKDDAEKLPSPDSLFKSVGRPSFLNDPHQKYINWDKFVKTSEEDEPNIHESDNYAAIPPPSSLNNTGTVTSKLTQTIMGTGAVEFSSPPVSYNNTTTTTTDRDDERDTEQATGGSKRSLDTKTDPLSDAPSAKRVKGEQFRVKEKRKRDIGQTSRGKNYVEEEKRILRQQFGSDEIMS